MLEFLSLTCLELRRSICCCRAPIGQGYGLTETFAGAAFSEADDPSVGRVGPPLPCCFIKVWWTLLCINLDNSSNAETVIPIFSRLGNYINSITLGILRFS